MYADLLLLRKVTQFGCQACKLAEFHHFFVKKDPFIGLEGSAAREWDRSAVVGVVPFPGTGLVSESMTGSVPGIGYT